MTKTKLLWPALIALAVAVPLTAQDAAKPEPIGSESCIGCHADAANSLKKSMHGAKLAVKGTAADKTCESCHGNGSLHAAAAGDKSNPGFATIKNPKVNSSKTCFACHKEKDLMGWPTSAHAQKGMDCTKCHSVHEGKGPKQLKKNVNETCYECHKKQKADFKLPSHHPVDEGKMSCVSCHSAHGGHAANLKAETVNETCAKCHSDKIGPMAFEHPPVTESCATCHKPHGSAVEAMLKQPQPVLCMRCHKVPHNNRSGNNINSMPTTQIPQRGRCTDCHREPHGSDRHAYFKN